jgi:hypothetical protein
MARPFLSDEKYAIIRQRLADGSNPNQAAKAVGVPHTTADRTAKVLSLYGGVNMRSAAFRAIVNDGPVGTLDELVQLMTSDMTGVINHHELAHVLWDMQKLGLVSFRESKREMSRLFDIRANTSVYARLGISPDRASRTYASKAWTLGQATQYRNRTNEAAEEIALIRVETDPSRPEREALAEKVAAFTAPLPSLDVLDDVKPVAFEDVPEYWRCYLHKLDVRTQEDRQFHRLSSDTPTSYLPASNGAYPLLRQLAMRRTKVGEAVRLLRQVGEFSVADLAAEAITMSPFEAEVFAYLEETQSELLYPEA